VWVGLILGTLERREAAVRYGSVVKVRDRERRENAVRHGSVVSVREK